MPLETEKLKFTLDLDKLDQSRIYTSKKGSRLLEFECVATPGGQYGQTHFITQRATKEERLAKVRLPILGNLALAFPPQQGAQPQRPAPAARPTQPTPTPAAGADTEDVPFAALRDFAQ